MYVAAGISCPTTKKGSGAGGRPRSTERRQGTGIVSDQCLSRGYNRELASPLSMLGKLEVSKGWCHVATHVAGIDHAAIEHAGIDHALADGVSR